jgi:DNA-binding NarL/FixJ family response regulator
MTAGTYPAVHADAVALLADLSLRRGRLEEAEALLQTVEHDAVSLLPAAAVKLARGDHATATALIERALRYHAAGTLDYVRSLELLVAVRLGSGDLAGARSALKRLQSLVTTDTWPEAQARSAMATAMVASARGRQAEALTGFENAIEEYTSAEMPLEAAQARLALAEEIARLQPDLAVVEANKAIAIFHRLGAATDADKAAALLRSLGVATPPGMKGAGALTQREQEVLRLVGAGLSNPEISERLFISQKTAAHHVSSVLTKLGLRNRAEAAAHMARSQPG